jgi:hypothetical protein
LLPLQPPLLLLLLLLNNLVPDASAVVALDRCLLADFLRQVGGVGWTAPRHTQFFCCRSLWHNTTGDSLQQHRDCRFCREAWPPAVMSRAVVAVIKGLQIG